MLFSATIFPLLLASVSIPLTTAQVQYTNALNVKFIAYLNTKNDLTPSIQHWDLTKSPNSPYAILTPPTSLPEQLFYINGTWWDSYHSVATLLTADVPTRGVVISSPTDRDSKGRRTVSLDSSGIGEVGVGVVPYPGPEPKLYLGSGALYACMEHTVGGVQVFLREWDELTPEGCADVTLLAQCVPEGPVHPTGTDANCCVDVRAYHCGFGGGRLVGEVYDCRIE